MRGEALDRAELRRTGLAGDRQYAFVKDAGRPHFPWLTGRDIPALVLHHARYLDARDPDRSPVRVRTPSGEAFALDDPALARAYDALFPIYRDAYAAMPPLWRRLRRARETSHAA